MATKAGPLRVLLLIGCALVLPACAQALGVDAYSSERAAGDPGALFDAKPVWPTGARCSACMKENCADQRATCDADSSCPRLLQARVDMRGPAGDYRRRYLPPLADEFWDWEHGGSHDPVTPINDLVHCSAVHCVEACELGRDFSCVGAFDWPATELGTKDLRFRFSDELGKTDWDVEYCLSIAPCSDAEGPIRTQTDSLGIAQLRVDTAMFASGIDGYVALDGGPDSYPYVLTVMAGPIESGFYFHYTTLSKAAVDAPYVALGGPTIDEAGKGPVWVYPKDCQGNAARHVTAELKIVTDPSRPYEDCQDCQPALYFDDTGTFDPNAHELNTEQGRMVLPSATPGRVEVIVRDTLTRRALAVQRLTTRPRTIHATYMYPASTRELSALPIDMH